MNVQRFQVDPRLTAYIESIWTFETEIGLPANDLRTIVPSARPKLVIPYRGRMFSVINNRRIEHPEASMILVGMMERSVVIDSSAIGVLAIEFKPGTVYRFLDFPLKEVTNTAYPLEVVLGKLGKAYNSACKLLQTQQEKRVSHKTFCSANLTCSPTKIHWLIMPRSAFKPVLG